MILFVLNVDDTNSEIETSSTGSYLLRTDYLGPKVYKDIKFNAAFALTLTDTKLQKSSRGIEKTYNPTVKLSMPVKLTALNEFLQGKCDLKYGFTKKSSKLPVSYAYTKHTITLEFQLKM